jgi:hypothetical protein
VEAQLNHVTLVARGDPRAADAARTLRELWAEAVERPEFVADAAMLLRDEVEDEVDQTEYADDRRDLRQFVVEMRALLSAVVEGRHGEAELPRAPEDLVRAWARLTERGVFDQAIEALRDPAVEEGLQREGLVREERELKTRRFRLALARWHVSGRIGFLKRVLKWGNLLLGSLAKVIPVLGGVKEFKEAGEAVLDEVSEGPPYSAPIP